MTDTPREIQGIIKYYSSEKGYGFIGTEHGTDYYFKIQNFKGNEAPCVGRHVLLTPSKKPVREGKAPQVSCCRYDPTYVDKENNANVEQRASRQDSRVKCPHCGKLMIPRVYVSNGAPVYNYCPFCGETYKDFGNPAIRTILLMVAILLGTYFLSGPVARMISNVFH